MYIIFFSKWQHDRMHTYAYPYTHIFTHTSSEFKERKKSRPSGGKELFPEGKYWKPYTLIRKNHEHRT